jgi:asparagine synthase (glutamine-hydrolysing)
MCGIAGFTGKKNSHELNRLLSLIEHRGRDGRSYYSSRDFQMGMNRLAVIDLSPDLYPMRYKHYAMVFNGEIYNFKDLKLLLQSRGVRFKTQSDAEVVLPLFNLYGPRAFEMLEGMFAISIYDGKKHQIILARDKSGEKPLYFATTESGIVFASEMKVLLSVTTVHKRIDRTQLPRYLTHGFVYAPGTLIQNIKKIPPASYMIYEIKTKQIATKPYWKPVLMQSRIMSDTIGNNEQRLDDLLRRSVDLRMVADVPVGCFLSGGVDSSLITYYASRLKPNIHTYSISFPGYGSQDESKFALYAAKRLQTKHTQIDCTGRSARGLFDTIETFIDEPIVDPAVLPTLLLAKEARKTVKVVLTGEGADELFGGYSRYTKECIKEYIYQAVASSAAVRSLQHAVFGEKFNNIFSGLQNRYSPQHAWTNKNLTGLLGHRPRPFTRNGFVHQAHASPLLRMQLADYRGYMAEQLLNKIDKSTMACNLEARAPYLDSNIVDFAFSLPDNQKIRFHYQGKYILKRVACRYFPSSFVQRPKHGFDVPLAAWFRRELRDYVYQSVDDAAKTIKLFRCSYYKHIVSKHMNDNSDHSGKIWSMIILTRWMKKYDIAI